MIALFKYMIEFHTEEGHDLFLFYNSGHRVIDFRKHIRCCVVGGGDSSIVRTIQRKARCSISLGWVNLDFCTEQNIWWLKELFQFYYSYIRMEDPWIEFQFNPKCSFQMHSLKRTKGSAKDYMIRANGNITQITSLVT